MQYPLVVADLQKLFVQVNVGIWDCLNQPVLNFELDYSTTAIADLCPAGELAYPIN